MIKILYHPLQCQCDDIGNGIIPGKGRRKAIEYEEEDERENVRHVLQRRIALIRRHVHIVNGDQEAGEHSSDGEKTDVITDADDAGFPAEQEYRRKPGYAPREILRHAMRYWS